MSCFVKYQWLLPLAVNLFTGATALELAWYLALRLEVSFLIANDKDLLRSQPIRWSIHPGHDRLPIQRVNPIS